MKVAALATALFLAACGGGGESGNNSTSEETAAPAPVEQIPAELQQDQTNSVVPLTGPSPAASPVDSPLAAPSPATTTAAAEGGRVPVPAALRGRWAMVDAQGAESCAPEHADLAKGTVTASADKFSYWESRGTPTRVEQVAPQRYVIDLTFEGEGQTWTRRTTFTLSQGGRGLTAATPGDPEPPMRDLRYRRCPA